MMAGRFCWVGMVGLGAIVVGCSSESPSDTSEPPADAAVPDAEVPPAPLAPVLGVAELEDINPDPGIVEVNLVAGQAEVELTPGQMTSVFAFNGLVPGPLLHARVGDRVIVHFVNELPEPTTIHWHGLRIDSAMDGNPMIQPPIPAGGSFDYDFVVPDAGTFWYHPHLNTVEQIERGLYGAIVVAEAEAPAFTTERLFVLDDVRLTSTFEIAGFPTSGMDWMMGRFGNTFLVNGSTEPAKVPAPRGAVERWRLLNAAAARTMEVGIEGASWRVVGTDGGLLPAPYTADRLSIAVGQRYDVEVVLDAPLGSLVRPVGYFLAETSDGGTEEVAMPIAELTLEGEQQLAPPVYPAVTLPAIPQAPIEKEIRLGMATVDGELVMTINGELGTELPMDELTQNQPVQYTIVNDIMHHHPFHLHGQYFQVLTREGQPANEPGLKDTVLVDGFETVTIATYFENPGEWMYHCHIAEHAELGMMAELRVVAAP